MKAHVVLVHYARGTVLQEGGVAGAQKVLQSFQDLVLGHLKTMKADFEAGKPFPQMPIIKDLKAFQVHPQLCLLAPLMAVSMLKLFALRCCVLYAFGWSNSVGRCSSVIRAHVTCNVPLLCPACTPT